MYNFRHLILIPFNVYFEDYGIYNRSDWFEKRFDIFKKLTLKSILGQSDSNFDCLLFFHKDWCTEEEINKINSLEKITPIFLYKKYDSEESILPILNKYKENYKYLIVTKFDSDDLINKDYVKTLNTLNLDDYKNKIISSQNGYVYRKFDKLFSSLFWRSPSIFSIIEESSTIYNCNKIFEEHGKVFSLFINDKKDNRIFIDNLSWFKCEHLKAGILETTKFSKNIVNHKDKEIYSYLKRKPNILNKNNKNSKSNLIVKDISEKEQIEVCKLFCIDPTDLDIL